jgi:hypothetical protein
VIEIVVEVIIFGQAPKVAILHLMQISDLGSADGWHLIDIIIELKLVI